MWTLAEKHSALMVSLEHRYYGESQPVADMSVENLKFLTSEHVRAWVGILFFSLRCARFFLRTSQFCSNISLISFVLLQVVVSSRNAVFA